METHFPQIFQVNFGVDLDGIQMSEMSVSEMSVPEGSNAHGAVANSVKLSITEKAVTATRKSVWDRATSRFRWGWINFCVFFGGYST